MNRLFKTTLLIALLSFPFSFLLAQQKEMMIRIAEIEVFPGYIEEYNALLREEAEASVRLERGVFAIFPMRLQDNPALVRIVEIYANQEAYQLHLKTAHFLKYKKGTLKMVKNLKLLDMQAIDSESMSRIFQKIGK
ncbi:MAG: putative quinol monooxygenase [Sphingobacterium sp.]